MFGYDDFWKIEQFLTQEKVQQLLDLTVQPPVSSIPNRVDTWKVDSSIIHDELQRHFGDCECTTTIKRWHNTSRLHADGKDHEFTVYVPLHTTLPDRSGVALFNAKWFGEYTVFGNPSADDSKPVKSDIVGIEKLPIPAKAGFDKHDYIQHVPKQFLDFLDVIEYYEFEIGAGLVWNPSYLHCSSTWTQPAHTRTHLLVAVKLI